MRWELNEPPGVSRVANGAKWSARPGAGLTKARALRRALWVPYASWAASGSADLRARGEGGQGQVGQTCNHDLDLPQGGVPGIREEEVHISRHAALLAGARLGLPLLCIQHNEGTLCGGGTGSPPSPHRRAGASLPT